MYFVGFVTILESGVIVGYTFIKLSMPARSRVSHVQLAAILLHANTEGDHSPLVDIELDSALVIAISRMYQRRGSLREMLRGNEFYEDRFIAWHAHKHVLCFDTSDGHQILDNLDEADDCITPPAQPQKQV